MSAEDELPRIPRAPEPRDDHGPEWTARRRELCASVAGRPLAHLAGEPVPTEEARGNVENLIGFAQVPVGIAGPLALVGGEPGAEERRELYVPLATTEGALVASTSRGFALTRDGGIRARVLAEGLTQNPVLLYADVDGAARGAEAARAGLADFAAIVAATTRHGALSQVRPQVLGRRLVVSLVFTTGDAIGINMAARGADLVAAELARRTGAERYYVHGQDVEKRANARALIEGRGRSAVAEAVVSRATLAERARVTPAQLVDIARTYAVGFAHLGTQNWLVQAANTLSALYLACGQDVAYVTESATGLLDLDETPAGDLYVSVTLPSLLVGTVGGGSGQGTAAECLDLLGVRGDGGGNRLAEIAAATVLAGDLSLMASFCAHEFVAAHEALGRNRPARDEKRAGERA